MTFLLTLILAIGTPAYAIHGDATWYDAPSRTDAAAGPALREMLGPDWRGRSVTVSYHGRYVTVRLTDWCACGDRHGTPTVIDLDDAAFRELAPLSRGVLLVTVEPARALPPTDTASEWTYPIEWIGRRRGTE